MAIKEKVAVAMSGGVDSSVAAAILKEKGYTVIGVTMDLWRDPFSESDSDEEKVVNVAVSDARKVANYLNIPHYTLDLSEKFKKEVVGNFINEYKEGRTPNPCVICNPLIKFGALFEKALDLGTKKMATGHYVRSFYDPVSRRHVLKKGIDKSKDQSYMLYGLNQAQLSRSVFPLGEMDKATVRLMGKKLGLFVSEKTDSQEICFIPGNDYRIFLKRHAGPFPSGEILNSGGEIIGRHKGLPFYTIGQRKGLGVNSPEPLYVIKVNPENNSIVVGGKEETKESELWVKDLNYIAIRKLEKSIDIKARIRYRAKEVPATLYPDQKDGKALVKFLHPQEAITPGQAVVFYQDDTVIGGGTITDF